MQLKPNVLIVEDEPAMGALTRRELERRGFRAVHVTSAEAALEAVDEQDFDTIVSDVRMGGMGGLELCPHLVAKRPDVPIILTTTLGDLDMAIAAIRVGAHDFLPKPFEMEELALRVQRATELHLCAMK